MGPCYTKSAGAGRGLILGPGQAHERPSQAAAPGQTVFELPRRTVAAVAGF